MNEKKVMNAQKSMPHELLLFQIISKSWWCRWPWHFYLFQKKIISFALNEAFLVYTFIIKKKQQKSAYYIYSFESHDELVKTCHIIHLNLEFVRYFLFWKSFVHWMQYNTVEPLFQVLSVRISACEYPSYHYNSYFIRI